MPKNVQILYHGNCFDGAVSAAIFHRFVRERLDPRAELTCRGMAHSRHDPYGPDHADTFAAEINAVVDFRYSASPRLTWWCDHHVSAFMSAADQAHFEADRSGRKRFDPQAPSCAGLLNRWLAEAHGHDGGTFVELVRWADLIDSASFASPAQAVELREPALQLMALLDAAPGAELSQRLIERLSEGSLERVHADPQVQAALALVLERNRASVELFRQRLQLEQGVAYFDLADSPLDGFNKFIPYYLHEHACYTVGVTASPRRTKVSVGSNPWRRPEPLVNIAELCGRYGGGGHPVVGAVTLPPGALAEARQVACEIVETLRASQSSC